MILEMITGKKIDNSKVGILNYIGFIVLIGIMILATVKDIIYPMPII